MLPAGQERKCCMNCVNSTVVQDKVTRTLCDVHKCSSINGSTESVAGNE